MQTVDVVALRWSHATTTEQFNKLCAKLDDDQTDSPWEYVAQQVAIDDKLDVTLRRTWHLNSEALIDLGCDLGVKALIPIQPLDPRSTSRNQVEIRALTSSRTVTPVPYRTLSDLGFDGDGSGWLAVPMTAEEYTSSPVLNVSASYGADKSPTHGLRLSQFWPSASFRVRFQADTPLSALSARFPEHATVDVTGTVCHISFKEQASSVEQLKKKFLQPDAPNLNVVLRTFYSNVDDYCFVPVDSIVGRLREVIEKSGIAVLGKKEFKNTRESWDGELPAVLAALKEWADAWNGGNYEFAKISEAADRLIIALKKGADFVIPSAVEKNGNIDHSLVLAELRDKWSGSVFVNAFVVPFTSEKEPGTQGKRSSLLLALLGAVLLVAAGGDLSWTPSWTWLGPSLDWLRNDGPDVQREAELRGVLVTLLLVFPAVLYAQFFQLRPKSPVGHRAQSGTFGLLSALYAAPLFPAAFLAAEGSLQTTSVMMVFLGLANLGAAAATWAIFSKPSLRWIRLRSLARSMRTAGDGGSEHDGKV